MSRLAGLPGLPPLNDPLPNRVFYFSRNGTQSQSHNRRPTSRGSKSSNGSKEATVKETTQPSELSHKRNLLGPLVLNPYRHRRHHSGGVRGDSHTPERKPEQSAIPAEKQAVVSRSKLLTQRQFTEKEEPKYASSTFKQWLKNYIEQLSKQKARKDRKEPDKRLNKRELIDKMSGRGVFKHRANYQVLDCREQLQPTSFLQGLQESCIIRTEEQNPHELGSMANLLHLIGK